MESAGIPKKLILYWGVLWSKDFIYHEQDCWLTSFGLLRHKLPMYQAYTCMSVDTKVLVHSKVNCWSLNFSSVIGIKKFLISYVVSTVSNCNRQYYITFSAHSNIFEQWNPDESLLSRVKISHIFTWTACLHIKMID